jgi:diketogulonate reductase-like aldo/keto reductase
MLNSSIPEITLNDGTAIPQLGFGTLAVQPDREATPSNIEKTGEIVGLALQAGYRHIDTAQAYGTERGVGKAIAASGIPRDQLYVTSKLSNANHQPDDVRRSFDETLALGLVSAAIVTWNIHQMNEIVERERAAGRLLDDIDIARLSPAIHAHINLNGRYHIHPDRPPHPLVPGRDGLATYK